MFILCCSIPRCRGKRDFAENVTFQEQVLDDLHPVKVVTAAKSPERQQTDTTPEDRPTRLPPDDSTSPTVLNTLNTSKTPQTDITYTRTLTKRCSGTLEAVKSTLIRHMSFDKSTNPRTSIGNSDEEVARRAELRQIRNKRIQSELGSDDERSDSPHASTRSNRHLSPYVDICQPGNGPRDTIEFSVDENSNYTADLCPPPVPSPTSIKTITSNIEPSIKTSRSNASSSINISHLPTSATDSQEVPCQVKDETGVTRPQQVHYLNAKPPIGIRYSFNQDLPQRLDANNDHNDESSGLSLWLAAQALRTSTVVSNNTPDVESNEPFHSHLEGFGGIDRIVEMPISQSNENAVGQLSLQSLLCEPVERRTLSKSTGSASLQIGTSTGLQDNAIPIRNGVFLASMGKSPAPKTDPTDTEPGSSFYPSKMPSFAPSPNHSQPYINLLSSQDLKTLELSPFEWHDRHSILQSPESSEDYSSYGTAEEYLPTPPSRAFANVSSSQSEVASLYQREAELQTIPKRFAAILSHQRSSSGHVTRFTESFEDLANERPQRHSLLGRLAHGPRKESTTKADHEAIERGGSKALKDFLTGTLPVDIDNDRSTDSLRKCSEQRTQSTCKHPRRTIWPLESWSKFPSHTRRMRIQQAGSSDNIKPKDFAVRRVLSDGRLEWSTDRDPTFKKRRLNRRAVTIPTRMGNAMKSSFSKLLRGSGSTSNLPLEMTSIDKRSAKQAKDVPQVADTSGCTSTSREQLLHQPPEKTEDREATGESVNIDESATVLRK